MIELDSEVAGSSKDTQRIQQKTKKPNYQERTDPWVDKNPPRRSRKVPCKHGDPYLDQTSKNDETRKGGGARH